MVGVRGFEPPTTGTPYRCATGLRHTPLVVHYSTRSAQNRLRNCACMLKAKTGTPSPGRACRRHCPGSSNTQTSVGLRVNVLLDVGLGAGLFKLRLGGLSLL